MTNYNERLDEIIAQASAGIGGFGKLDNGKFYKGISEIEAKQAILDWHNKQVEEAMAKFHLKKGVKYDVKASDSVIVITHTNKLKEQS